MFLGLFFVLIMSNWCPVNTLVAVPAIYRKAETALDRYFSQPAHNPVIHSLLNILIHDKQSRAFITDQAIDIALEHMKVFDQQIHTQNEPIFREIIYGKPCTSDHPDCLTEKDWPYFQPTSDLKDKISSVLDKFFASSTLEEFLNTDKSKESKV